jgi:uncharacterized membrane protein YiaA
MLALTRRERRIALGFFAAGVAAWAIGLWAAWRVFR